MVEGGGRGGGGDVIGSCSRCAGALSVCRSTQSRCDHGLGRVNVEEIERSNDSCVAVLRRSRGGYVDVVTGGL